MDPEYKAAYRDLFARHWWWRARKELVLSTVDAIRPGRSWGAILDVGCGDGLLFDDLASRGEVEGVEPDASLLTPGGRWHDRIHVGPFDETFRPGKVYGLILLLDVLEHLPDAPRCLARARELLDVDGRLVITVPAFRLLWTTHDTLNEHYMRYTRRGIAALATRARVRIHEARYFFHWTAPVKLAVRVKETVRATAAVPPRVPPSWINESLYRLSRLEQRALAPLALPFGSSLLVVAGRR
jgi:2-polyprenyl-3-methyl-5-hydroxy-6-metoxy-1,4-benzoquinol methylase